MSWRKFLVLLKGISGDSTLANVLRSEPKVIEDAALQERKVKSVWGL